ncbi:MAG TPA: dihydropteroate synthase [Alphaproteobacteria bacterium]|nr:dihydropteroate synthase [Alphaproteobacteria bacterium]
MNLRLRERFDWGARTYVMGILNVTPDSFSGDGLIRGENWVARAVEQGLGHIADGAHILDVGGESTRPGATPIPVEEEIRRVVPVIEGLVRHADVPISIDTSKAEVAQAALDAGAVMINDVWGLRLDPGLAALAAERRCPVILMHNRSRPQDARFEQRLGGRYVGARYENLLEDVAREMMELADAAMQAGVDRGQIVLDPGIGFGKTVEQNLELIRSFDRFRALGFPLLCGPSRKSFIGYTLDLPAEERVEGTAAAVAIAIARGADIVRVHDVKPMARVARMCDAILRR